MCGCYSHFLDVQSPWCDCAPCCPRMNYSSPDKLWRRSDSTAWARPANQNRGLEESPPSGWER